MFDFGIGSFELMMLAIVAIIVVGPKDLPKLLRSKSASTKLLQKYCRKRKLTRSLLYRLAVRSSAW